MGRYHLWGAIPVVFDRNGAWDVDVSNPVVRLVLGGVVTTLATLNRLTERLLREKVSMNIPMRPSR